jgi:hypothetical protein
MDKVICTHCEEENPGTNRYCSSCGYELPKIEAVIIDSPIQPPERKKTVTGKKSLGVIIGVAVFVISFFAVQQLFFKAPLFDKAMMSVASEINKSCPIMIDTETRLDNAIALPKNVFQYNYTLVNIDKASTDTLGMRKIMEPNIINYVKTNPQMRPQREHKTTVNYYYKDKAGSFLILISVTPEKYQ